MVNLTGWGFGSEKTVSVDGFLERRFLTWLDDASDVAIVLWALLPMPFTLMATANVPPFPQNPGEGGTSAWEALQAGQHLLCCAAPCHPPGASPGLGGGQVSALPLPELWRQDWAGRCCGSRAEMQPAIRRPLCPVPCSSCPHQQPLLIRINSSAILVSACCALQLM